MVTDPIWHRDSIGSLKPMQESSQGADHGSDLCLHVSLYAVNCSEHVYTKPPGAWRNLRAVDEGAVPASAPATSRVFVLPIAARRWVSTDNRGTLCCRTRIKLSLVSDLKQLVSTEGGRISLLLAVTHCILPLVTSTWHAMPLRINGAWLDEGN